MTQKADLLLYLDHWGTITRLEAFQSLGIAELSSRIGELESDGFVIPRETITVTARNGRKCKVMSYRAPTVCP